MADPTWTNLPDEPATILYVGHHETKRSAPVAIDLLTQAQSVGYDVLTTPITTDRFQSRVLATFEQHVEALNKASSPGNVPSPLIAPLLSDDSDLGPEESNSSLIALVSPWIDIGSPDPLIADVSRQVLNLEVTYAAFCGISNVLITGPLQGSDATQFGRCVLEAIGLGPYLQLHILVPMTGEVEQDISAEGAHLSELAREQYLIGPDESDGDGEEDLYQSWQCWNTIRTICSYNSKVSVALELPRQLPHLRLQSRWYSEPVRLLTFPRTSFIRNAKGFPVLSKVHQEYLTRFLRLRFPPWVLLCDVAPIPSATGVQIAAPEPTPAEAASARQKQEDDPLLYLKYMRHLQQTQPYRPPMERFGQGYQDYMQSPLQPLTDNLESITYEVFEKDPVKYEWYERAVALALGDLQTKLGYDRPIVVAVVGAGRGPLVTRVLQASKKTGVAVRAYAVEKNPNAHLLLQRRNATDPFWNNTVTVVKTDMRSWPGPISKDGTADKVDILVSELLGSFADNELSPECLDGVQHVLHLDHGINIPQSYSAHFTPIATPRLYADLLSRATTDLNMSVQDKWELPYVVMLHQYDFLSSQTADEQARSDDGNVQPMVKDAWSFSHPAPVAVLEQAKNRAGGTMSSGPGGWLGGDGTNDHNSRSCTITFPIRHQGVCHGLAGYFETVLYRSTVTNQAIELSTNPVTMEEKSKDMISWFPIFFPLKSPILAPEDGEIEVKMWRQTDGRKVWYEWVVDVFQRVAGRREKVGISELMSSKGNGCLM